MREVVEVFRANLSRSRALIVIFRVMNNQTTRAVDLADVLRAALVQAVSSFDLFVHEIVRVGMLEAYRSERPRTRSFSQFQVTLSGALEGISNAGSSSWFDLEIRQRHGHRSFQFPDSVADAVRLISDVELWNEVSTVMGTTRNEVRERLSLIVERRNKIVHEADISPDFAGQTSDLSFLSPIDDNMVEDTIDFLEQLGVAVFNLVSTYSPKSSGI